MTDWADVAAGKFLSEQVPVRTRAELRADFAALLRRTREDEREASAAEADNHECGGANDIICQHLNCGMVIAAAIRSRRGT